MVSVTDDHLEAQLFMFLRSLSPDQLTVYARQHPSQAALVDIVRGERLVHDAIWPLLVDGLGEERAAAFWHNAVEIDDHQAALRAGMTMQEVLAAALEVTNRQFEDGDND